MTKRLVLLFVLSALAVASAKTYTVTLFQPSLIAGTELRPGDYKLSLDNDKVVISNGRTSVESAVKVEQADTKYGSTSVRYAAGEGKPKVQEIRLRGTRTKLVFN